MEAEADRSIAIEEIDFLRWDVSRRKVHEAILTGRAEVEKATAAADQRIQAADKATQEEFARLGQKYGFDPAGTYAVDDVQFRLTPKVK